MKQKITMIILFIGLNTIAQIKFEKGYFISNDGVKTEGLIKNVDWKNNPTYFIFKEAENSTASTKSITNVKGFKIYNESHYVRATVQIDKSSNDANHLSKKRIAEYVEETLFLKLIVEGPANLYIYKSDKFGGERLFYSLGNDFVIKQLEYKRYETIVGGKIRMGTNNNYQKQLRDYISCGDLKTNRLRYTRSSLAKYFISYNECKDVNYKKNSLATNKNLFKQPKAQFNIKAKISGNFSSLATKNKLSSREIDFGSKLTPSFGLEAEYILPFNNNKWSMFIEPTFQSFSASKEYVYNSGVGIPNQSTTAHLTYKSFQIPLGIRHYMFLNDNSKLFINLAFAFSFDLDSTLDYEYQALEDLKASGLNNLIFGIGYSYNNKYSIEFSYSKAQILTDYNYWDAPFKNISITFGYTLF